MKVYNTVTTRLDDGTQPRRNQAIRANKHAATYRPKIQLACLTREYQQEKESKRKDGGTTYRRSAVGTGDQTGKVEEEGKEECLQARKCHS